MIHWAFGIAGFNRLLFLVEFWCPKWKYNCTKVEIVCFERKIVSFSLKARTMMRSVSLVFGSIGTEVLQLIRSVF